MNTESVIFILVFLFLGAVTGWLFRNVGIIKVLIILFALPTVLDFLIALNFWASTGPFLVGAFANFFYLRSKK